MMKHLSPAAHPLPLVLASTSPFRKEVLARLHLPFSIFAPNADETPLAGETPQQLVLRLAEVKARTAHNTFPSALIIGSDQIAVIDDHILGKPGDHDRAVAQLRQASGRRVDFITGLCVYNSATGTVQSDIVTFGVVFRLLNETQIDNYVRRDQPYHCAGSFKSEGLGIALLERMEGTDPTAVIGLPLIRLVRMLEQEGVEVV
jgi:septum formation protein